LVAVLERIRGIPIWVSSLLDILASGVTFEEVLEDDPHLTRGDIIAAIAYDAPKLSGVDGVAQH
jgi:uncharacterized protein (DUF433 family)